MPEAAVAATPTDAERRILAGDLAGAARLLPDPSAPDALELESLRKTLATRYGVSRFESLPDGITFGELFQRALGARPGTSTEWAREG